MLIVLLGFKGASLRASLPGIPAIAASAVARADAAARPDIVMVLVDGHGRPDVLERDYGYDMRRLRDTLTRLGFAEAPDSRANHTNTRFSLSVLLNGRPMAELGQDMAEEVDEEVPAAALSAATDLALLRSMGYRIVTLTSGYAEVRVGEPGEVVDVGPWNELEQTVLRSTLVGRVVDADRAAQAAGARERVQRELDYLVDLARKPGSSAPLFAFIHVPTPHPPWCSRRIAPRDRSTISRVMSPVRRSRPTVTEPSPPSAIKRVRRLAGEPGAERRGRGPARRGGDRVFGPRSG